MNDMHQMNQLKENINNNKDIKHENIEIIIDNLLMILQITKLYIYMFKLIKFHEI